jgi:3',5'-cyclic AMP phosphodiesterase CpdA
MFASNRRSFLRTVLTGAAGLSMPGLPNLARGAASEGFRFVLLGDLHYDKLEHHDLDWLGRDKPDDLRQVKDYSRLTREVLPQLFSTVRQTIRDNSESPGQRIDLVVQVGDLVEGLCGNPKLAEQQNGDALGFVRGSDLGVPFLFAKGNHDITGPGAVEVFQQTFHPFLAEQAGQLQPGVELKRSSYAVGHSDSLFCFYDAYDKESLGWLEATLARRTARHCFVVLHPPVVPYGARATWHLYSHEREQAARARFLDLLGKNNAFVLGGHIHKYNLLVRSTPGGGRFLQLAVSSVIPNPAATAEQVLTGIGSYTPDQVKVEPNFSPATETQRRAVYPTEAPFVKAFEYADLPGYAVLTVAGNEVSAKIYSTVTRKAWRTLDLTKLMAC